MTNGNNAGGDDQGSPSNSPRRHRPAATGANNPPPRSPHRRGGAPPVMGIPGQSAFTPYTRPGGGPSGSGIGSGFAGSGYGFPPSVAQAVPVGGSGYGGVAAPGALRIGGSPSARKRVREGGAAAAPGGEGAGAGAGAGGGVNCSVCGKAFATPKALFGHMRSHPDRGWKGAHPPPTFRAEEEFADLRGLNLPEAGGADEAGEGGAEAAREAEEEAGDYRLPDLNNPPPPDAAN